MYYNIIREIPNKPILKKGAIDMAWYYGEHKCGHEGRINLTGPKWSREYRRENFFNKICDECYKAKVEEERQRQTEKALKNAEAEDLPELVGTEKQVDWALRIRNEWLGWIDNMYKKDLDETVVIKCIYSDDYSFRLGDAVNAVEDIVVNETDVAVFIDYREIYNDATVYKLVERSKKLAKKKEEESNLLDELAKALIVKDVGNDNDYVEIIPHGAEIRLKYKRDDDVRREVKDRGFTWNGNAWVKEITKYTGSIEDRMADIANRLLELDYNVAVFDETAREKAISGSFEPEQDRLIWLSKDEKKLILEWFGYYDDVYSASRKISGSRWDFDYKYVTVPSRNYKQVVDFSNEYGFIFTDAANEFVEKMMELELNALTEVEVAEKVERKTGRDLDNPDTSVIDDLKDELDD